MESVFNKGYIFTLLKNNKLTYEAATITIHCRSIK